MHEKSISAPFMFFRGRTLVKRSFTIEMRSDEMAGAAERRVPLHLTEEERL